MVANVNKPEQALTSATAVVDNDCERWPRVQKLG